MVSKTLQISSVVDHTDWIAYQGDGTVTSNVMTINGECVASELDVTLDPYYHPWYKVMLEDANLTATDVVQGIELVFQASYDSCTNGVAGVGLIGTLEATVYNATGIAGSVKRSSSLVASTCSNNPVVDVVHIGSYSELYDVTWTYDDLDGLEVWFRKPQGRVDLGIGGGDIGTPVMYVDEDNNRAVIVDNVYAIIYYTTESEVNPTVQSTGEIDVDDSFVVDGVIYPYLPEQFTTFAYDNNASADTLHKNMVAVGDRSTDTAARPYIYKRNELWQTWRADFTVVGQEFVDQILALYSINKNFFIRFDDEMSRTINGDYVDSMTELHNVNGDRRVYLTPTYPIKQSGYSPLLQDVFDYHVYLFDGTDFLNIKEGFSVDKHSGTVVFQSKLLDTTRVFMAYTWRIKVRVADYNFQEISEEANTYYTGHVLFYQVEEEATDVENYYRYQTTNLLETEDFITTNAVAGASVPAADVQGVNGSAVPTEGVCSTASWGAVITYAGTKTTYNTGTSAQVTTAWLSDGSNLAVNTQYTSVSSKGFVVENDGTVEYEFTYSGADPVPDYLRVTFTIDNSVLASKLYHGTLSAVDYHTQNSFQEVSITANDNPDMNILFDNIGKLYTATTSKDNLVSEVVKECVLYVDPTTKIASVTFGLNYGVRLVAGNTASDYSTKLSNNIGYVISCP